MKGYNHYRAGVRTSICKDGSQFLGPQLLALSNLTVPNHDKVVVKRPKGRGFGKTSVVGVSSRCAKGKHSECTKLKCTCSCHPSYLQPSATDVAQQNARK